MSSVVSTPSASAATAAAACSPTAPRRRRRRTKKPLSPGAERTRLYRERLRHGLRCVTIEIRLAEIQELAQRGYLGSDCVADPNAVTDAMHRFLDDTLRSTARRVASGAG